MAITSTWDENACIYHWHDASIFQKNPFFTICSFFWTAFSAILRTHLQTFYLVHLGQQAVPESLKRKDLTFHWLDWSFHASIFTSQFLIFVSNTGIYEPCFPCWNTKKKPQPWSKCLSSRQQHNCCSFAIISNYLLWLPISHELVKSWSQFNQWQNSHWSAHS